MTAGGATHEHYELRFEMEDDEDDELRDGDDEMDVD